MAYRFTLDDVAFLRSEPGAEALAAAELLDLDGASLIGDLTRLRRSAGGHAAAAAETVVLRRRAVARWGSGSWREWFCTDEALQQASPPPVAEHRARRLLALATGGGYDAIHDVTCSVGAEVAALARLADSAGAGLAAVGSDIDPVRIVMAQANLRAAGVRPLVFRADARTVTTRNSVRYADPARRDGTGRRITSADTIPSVDELDAADRGAPPVLRLPPGIDYERLMRPGEIELVSWNGTVREAVSWPRWACTDGQVTRRATVLTGSEGDAEQLTDADPAADDVTAPRRYLVDPDPAVVRAHLVQHYAARYGLTRLDEHLAYLTGDAIPPGTRGFEIVDVAPFSERTIRGWAERDGIGTLEIKQRGTPVVPDELRRRLRLRGDTRRERTLIVARIGRAPVAFWCRAAQG